jgi:ABC-type glycerol-3-phosphate transport system substrate-binding protein
MLGPKNSQRPISRRSYLRSSGLLMAGLASGLLTACGAAVPTAGTSSTGSGAAAASQAGGVTTTRQATSSAGGAAAPSPVAATSAATTTVAASPSSSTGVAGKQVTIVYVSPDDPGRHEVEQAIFADFTKANPGITVQVTSGGASWTTEQQKLTASIAGGESPNCYVIGWGAWYAFQAALLDLTTFMARDKVAPANVFEAVSLDYYTQNGKLWALPVVGISVDAMAYNQDLLEAAGLPIPPTDPNDATWTMDRFLAYAQKLTKADQLQFGFGGQTGGGDVSGGGMSRPSYYGQQPWDDQAKKAQYDQPKALQGQQFFKDLTDKYQVQPTAAQKTAIGAKGDVFTSGKIGLQVVYGYIPKLTFRWGIAALPHSGSENMSGRQNAAALQLLQAPQADQTWTLFHWLMQPENAARFPLSAKYAVSPVNGASTQAMEAFKSQVGVDPVAYANMAQHAHFESNGMYRYPGWSKCSAWFAKNFPLFQSGQLSASDYGKAATDYINANLTQTT